jgi:hypothetical protein
MYKKHPSPKPSSRGTRRECCTEAPCDAGLRNQYFEGKRLTAESFRVEQDYALERRRLLNRAIHGWGVVYGYALKSTAANGYRTGADAGGLEIGAGLALDACGRELLYTRATTLKVSDAILLDENGMRMDRSAEGAYGPEACWLLSAHYAEQRVGPVRLNDPCSCERNEWEHVCETVRFTLRRVDCDECCRSFDCELECGCGAGPCCEEPTGAEPYRPGYERHEPGTEAAVKNPVRRGGCQCLCQHLAEWSDTECDRLQGVDEPCGHVRVALRHGVPLACVRLRKDDCDAWQFDSWIEACGPRRLVKRNDALFDLIRGCDLTRISAIGWAPWHRASEPVEWADFRDSFSDESLPSPRRGREQTYWVEFSRPVRKDTVRPDCFAMTVIAAEDEAGWGEARRVPIVDVETVDASGPRPGLVTRATLVFDAGWISDAIESRKKIFNQNDTQVEIEIRGDYIVDCNGQALDANAVGLSPAPTGNGSPGGTFVSIFRVHPRESRQRPPAYDNTYRA